MLFRSESNDEKKIRQIRTIIAQLKNTYNQRKYRAKIRKIPHIFPTSAKKCLIEIFHVKLLDIHILLIINEINAILFILASIFI